MRFHPQPWPLSPLFIATRATTGANKSSPSPHSSTNLYTLSQLLLYKGCSSSSSTGRRFVIFHLQTMPFGMGRKKAGKGGVEGSSSNKPRVLIVEDNHVSRKVLRKLLLSLGVESQEVENGREAVELCRGGAAFDIIIMDKEMPVMDGPQATRLIREMGVRCRMIGLSASTMEGDREEFLCSGIDEFYPKPMARHQMLALLEQLRSG